MSLHMCAFRWVFKSLEVNMFCIITWQVTNESLLSEDHRKKYGTKEILCLKTVVCAEPKLNSFSALPLSSDAPHSTGLDWP